MAEDWGADVKRYDANADDDVIAGIVRYCGIALRKRDSSLVSFTDATETGRVRENFLKKKLGLTHSDSDLDSAIAEVGERMKGDNFKNRVTAYYLLTDRFGLHHLFRKGGSGPATEIAEEVVDETVTTTGTTATAATAGAAAAGAAGLASIGDRRTDEVHATAPQTAYDETLRSSEVTYGNDDDRPGGLGWLWWLLGLLLLGLLLWWLFFRQPTTEPATVPTATDTVVTTDVPATDGAVDLGTAPAEGSVTIPDGAGVTVETRNAKPVAKVYFDTAKTDVAPAFGATALALKGWLDANPGSSLAISGFNDPTGNAAANAELSKNRAEAVRAALVKAGVPEASTELVKPEASTDVTTDKASARRVEVVVR